ncbi:MAG: glycerol-3-phosphate 1-O-acyltransferase PlsY [Lachnospiraceae bacterium]|nr:glycerol-3-phosphate 1-O-acyltransferase PlsY [Lachnospiraceae bacterium]
MERIICIVIGYIFGLFQTGYLYGRLHHVDIRQYGSGNAGTTNALRVLGKKAGIITYIGDCLKAVVAGFVIRLLFKEGHSEIIKLLVMYGGLGVVLGHNYPFYLHFKGGKGIAATSGMVLAFDWRLALCICAVFILVVVVSRYVSLASLIMMVVFMSLLILGGQTGQYGLSPNGLYEVYLIGGAMTLLAFYKHKANIIRLLQGTESKLGEKKAGNMEGGK